MAKTLDNISLTYDTWTDISDVSGIPEGTAYEITNLLGSYVLLFEDSVEPSSTEINGQRLSVFPDENSKAFIADGSLKIWARSLNDQIVSGSTIHVGLL